MTLPAFATVDDLGDRLGRTIEADTAEYLRAQAALDDASALIRLEAGTSWVTDGAVDFGDLDDWKQDAIVTITINAARRSFENPEGASSRSLGDASVTLGNDSSDVFLKASEKTAIRRIVGGSGSIGSLTMEIGTPGWSGDYIDVAGQDEPLPFTYEPLLPS